MTVHRVWKTEVTVTDTADTTENLLGREELEAMVTLESRCIGVTIEVAPLKEAC